MKKLFFLLILISFQTSYCQWEPTSWKSSLKHKEVYVTDSVIVSYSNLESELVRISRDQGKTWRDISNGLPHANSLTTLAVKGNTIIISCYGGVWISSDLGETWEIRHVDSLINQQFNQINVVNKAIVGIGGNNIFFSMDDGKTWKSRRSNIDSKYVIHSIANNGETIYVTTSYKVYRSTDYGATWNTINPLININGFDKVAVNGYNILIGTSTALQLSGKVKFYYSRDWGASWDTVSKSIDEKVDWYELEIVNNSFIANMDGTIYLSENYGESWTNVMDKLPEKLRRMVAGIFTKDNKLYVYSYYELWYTDRQFKDWTPVVTQENYGHIKMLKSIGNRLYAGSSPTSFSGCYLDGIYYSSDEGGSWQRSGLDSEDVIYLYQLGDTLIAGYPKGIAISGDSGATWIKRKHTIGASAYYTPSFEDIFIIDRRVYVRIEQKYYYSDNFGVRWESAKQQEYDGTHIQSIAVDQNRVFAGHERSVFYSTNGGANWINITSNLPFVNNGIRAIAPDGDEIYIVTSIGIYYTSDLGNSWLPANGELSISKDFRIVTLYKTGKLVLISVYRKGVYYSTNSGKDWKLTTGLDNSSNYGGKFAVHGDYIYFGSNTYMAQPDGDVIYRAKISELLSAPDEKKKLQNFTISPNPAGDFISISNYNGSDRSFAILNLLGQEILSGEFTDDRISVASLTPGAYLIRIGNEAGMMLKK